MGCGKAVTNLWLEEHMVFVSIIHSLTSSIVTWGMHEEYPLDNLFGGSMDQFMDVPYIIEKLVNPSGSRENYWNGFGCIASIVRVKSVEELCITIIFAHISFDEDWNVKNTWFYNLKASRGRRISYHSEKRKDDIIIIIHGKRYYLLPIEKPLHWHTCNNLILKHISKKFQCALTSP